jgi:hypothetical protein
MSLTESELSDMMFRLAESMRRAASRMRENSQLFENLPDCNLRREPERQGEFLIFFRHNPLKSPDSKK